MRAWRVAVSGVAASPGRLDAGADSAARRRSRSGAFRGSTPRPARRARLRAGAPRRSRRRPRRRWRGCPRRSRRARAVSGSSSGSAAKISPVVTKPRSLTRARSSSTSVSRRSLVVSAVASALRHVASSVTRRCARDRRLRSTLATRSRCAAPRPSRRFLGTRRARSRAPSPIARSSPARSIPDKHPFGGRFDRVRHQAHVQRLRLVVADRFLDRDPLEQVVHRSVARRERVVEVVGRRRSLRTRRVRPDRRTAERRASRRRAPARARRTAAGRPRAGRRDRRVRSRARMAPEYAARGGATPPPARGARATASRSRSASMSSPPASFITYWSRTRSLGCSATIAAATSAAPRASFERRRRRPPSTRSSRNCRNGVAGSTRLQRAACGSSCHTSAGSRPAGRSATSSWIS